MASAFRSIAAILLSTVFFLMANGLIGTLTPLTASLSGFSHIAVGAIGTGYFVGFVAGCLLGPHLVAKIGHVRGFTVAAVGAATAVLLQPLWTAAASWLLLRALSGLCIAILFMTVESWLNDRSPNETRGRILALYIVASLAALMLGQWLLLIAPAQSFVLFSVGAVLYCFGVIPISLTRLPPPQPPLVPRVNLWRIVRAAPVAAAGCLTVGLANGAFWTLAPIYTQSLGFDASRLAAFMSIFILGGTLFEWPIGRLSDRMDRRWMIAATCTAAAAAGFVLGLFGWLLVRNPTAFFAVVFALGAAMLPLYALSIAHANDRLPQSEFVEASAALLLLSTVTSIPAPVVAAAVMNAGGASSLFLYTAIAHAAMAFYAFTRIQIREAAALETRDAFRPVSRGSPASGQLDPRAQEKEKST